MARQSAQGGLASLSEAQTSARNVSKSGNNQGGPADIPERQAPKPNSACIVRKDDIDEGGENNNLRGSSNQKTSKKANIELLTDHAFSRAFDDSTKSLAHGIKLYNSVQTCLKSKRGIGEPIIVKFYAPMNMSDTSGKVEYNYRSLGDDVELIQTNQFKYCLKQCFKMAYFIAKLHDIEILRMQCEFLKDDNKTIWFSYADQIVFRRIKS